MGEAGANAEDDMFKLGIWLINKVRADISHTKTNVYTKQKCILFNCKVMVYIPVQ